MNAAKTQELSMRIIAAPLAVLRFQYRLARLPLQMIEERVVARMDSEAPARLFFERSFGLLDVAVGNALGDVRLRKRGGALAKRSDTRRRAAQLDTAAEQARDESSADLKAASDKAVEDQKDAHAAKERKVEAARSSAQERKRLADEAAAQRVAAARKQADDVAAQRKNSVEAAKRDEHARITATEQKASADAKSKLDDAQAMRVEADTKRSRADRVEELADIEKHKRKSEQTSNT